jgi:Ni/Co efflux regulator RcnB
MKKLILMLAVFAVVAPVALSSKTATQIKNEERAKAYKTKKAQEKAERDAKRTAAKEKKKK